ncbi:MAG TPA: serine/threonine-protein kinase [Kofleriaceae bacterium]|nr:serine/threonine-protein kinase [Kofleriaceae bacterium]
MAVERFGAYEVYEQLGIGGMATVHRARTATRPNTAIALKRLLPQMTAVPELVQAFLDEAQLAGYLDHPNVARTYDYGRFRDSYFIAMELVRGATLSHVITRCRELGREVPLPVALSILIQLCDALDYAHNLRAPGGEPLRIIHRDVTPSNVIVSTDGIAKLIDFGIAKAASSSVRTKTGFIKGKFGYVAPEYVAGQASAMIDPRVDLFALGIVAHELLARKKLFQVDNDFETLRRVQSMPIVPPSRWNPHVPSALDAVVMTALERDPEHRWQTAREVRDALASVAAATGPLPTPAELAQWVDDVMGPQRPSDASAVTIDISLIEDKVPGFVKRIAGSQRRHRTRAVGLAAFVAVVALGLATYAVAAY